MTFELDGFEIVSYDNDYWIDERGEEVRIIEQDINDIHDIMVELNGAVDHQGVNLGKASTNIQRAKEKTSKANIHLKDAKKT